MTSISMRDVVIEFPVARGFRHIAHRARGDATGGRLDDRRNVVRALDKISLEVREGDRVGIIGHNGAGKSTLLRVIGGIYAPQSGSTAVDGKVSALFHAAPGLEVDDNGWQNIVNCGLYLGMSRDELARKAGDIAEFSELGEFLDMPVRTYSSGMLMRLSFAIATAIDPEILLLDEALGTGDARFALKAQERLAGLVERSAILVMTSHSPSELRSYCNRAVYLEKGRIVADGPIDQVMERYYSTVVSQAQANDAEGLGRALTLTQDMTKRGEAVPPALEEQSLRAALQIHPDDASMLMRLCRVLQDQDKPVPTDLEIRAMQAGLRRHPDDQGLAQRLRELTEPSADRAARNAEGESAAERPMEEPMDDPLISPASAASTQAGESGTQDEPRHQPVPGPPLINYALAVVQGMASRGEPISLQMEEMALYIGLELSPGDQTMLLRLCKILVEQGKPVPVSIEIPALENALRTYPDNIPMGKRLRDLAAIIEYRIPGDVQELIAAQEATDQVDRAAASS